MSGRHVMEALGLSRVTVVDGKVIDVTQPRLRYCPMFAKMGLVQDITAESVRKNIEFRIRDFGLFTENRIVRAGDTVTFGVSEILSLAMRNGQIDAACIVADGCGSAIITEPELLQGLCGRISGIIETSPLNVVLDQVGDENVIDPEAVPIDQRAIAAEAAKRDYRRFAVTVSDPDEALAMRWLYGDQAVIVGVHTSGRCHTERFFEACDFITACASGSIRKRAYRLREEGKCAIAGNKVQIVAVSEMGRKLVGDKLESLGRTFWDGTPEPEDPVPLFYDQ